MGTMRHHAIIVTSWDKGAIDEAHAKAADLMEHVSGIVPGVVNGQASFAVLPDGSKEWWDTSDKADEARAQFIEWMGSRKYLDYAAVSFGELSATFETNCNPIPTP
ncbi:hypothetical protein [Sulfitobacter sp. PS-8MA]|uniref:hypothetical protein n=1 Tax=Sulfitobacter sp. PS-8MA TaxID=3237707 RepID=UPI0034C5EB2A